MRYTIQDDALTVYLEDDDRALLETMKLERDDFDSDDCMSELLESLVCNSELSWISAGETGDLTDAPILGLRGANGEILSRWAFMDYQTVSVQQRLLDAGKAVFIGGQ